MKRTFSALVLGGLLLGCEPRAASTAPSALAVSTKSAPSSAPPNPTSNAAKQDGRATVRYLALGDSFTIGTGSSPEQAFPSRLAERLRLERPSRLVALENLGVNGFTTDDLIRDELPEVARFRPTFVTLAIGANDLVHGSSVERYRAQLQHIFEALAASGVEGRRIACLPQPDWARSPAARDFGAPDAIEQAIDAFNATLREEAARAGATYVDLAALFREEARAGMIAGDGLHPSAEAHAAWAAALDEKTRATIDELHADGGGTSARAR